jgi:single-strand DNA-binding protein
MINKVILYGNVGQAPEIFLTQDGREVASVSLATSVHWKDKTGEWQSATDWHQIAVFREATVIWIKNSLRRGDKVHVEGKLTYQHWTDKQGKEHRTTQVVVSGFSGTFKRLSKPIPQHNELIPETQQDSASSLTENEDICPPLEDSLSTQPSHHKGEITDEN